MAAVYVLSNPSLVGLHKVGYTDRQVKQRLSELNSSTSIPTKFQIEYFVELEESTARDVEQATHRVLERLGFHHGKEYFKCSAQDCRGALIAAIAELDAVVLYAEDADVVREKVAREKALQEHERKVTEAAAAHEAAIEEKERGVLSTYDTWLATQSDPGNFLVWWAGSGAVCAVFISWLSSRISDGNLFTLSALSGVVVAYFARQKAREVNMSKPEHLARVSAREKAVSEVRSNHPVFVPPPAPRFGPLASETRKPEPAAGAGLEEPAAQLPAIEDVQDVENFGTDLIEMLDRTVKRTQWNIQHRPIETFKQKATVTAIQSVLAFGEDLVECVLRRSVSYYQRTQWKSDGPFHETVSIGKDVENYGSDLCGMAEGIAGWVYSTRKLNRHWSDAELQTYCKDALAAAVKERDEASDIIEQAANPDFQIRLALANRVDATSDALEVLMNAVASDSTEQRDQLSLLVLRHPNCPLDILEAWAEDSIYSPGTPEDLAIAENPNCPSDILTLLWWCNECGSPVDAAVKRHANFSEQTVAEKINEKFQGDRDDRRQLARREDIPTEVLDRLSMDEAWTVRKYVAMNSQTSAAALSQLSKRPLYAAGDIDDDQFERVESELSDEDDDVLEEHWAPYLPLLVRRCAQENPANVDFYPITRGLSPHDSSHEDLVTASAIKLATHPDLDVRQTLARRSDTPAKVLHVMATDNDASIRAVVAANPNCPADLFIEFVRDPVSHVRIAAGHNPACTKEANELLASSPFEEYRRLAAAHQNTGIAAFRKLKTDSDRNVLELLVKNPNCPLEIRAPLYVSLGLGGVD